MGSKRHVITTLAVALLFVVAGFAGPGGASVQEGEEGTSTISATASGTVEAEPDLAVVQVAVVQRADSANAARQALANNVSRLRTALAANGIADDQLRTVAYFIDEDVEFTDEGERIVHGYVATQAFEIELPNVSRAGPIIDIAVNEGATRVEGVTFTLSDDRQRQLRTEALGVAMENARADADAVAAGANLTVTGVHSVSTGDVFFAGQERAFAEAEAADAGTVIDPGPVSVTASVSVVYNATRA